VPSALALLGFGDFVLGRQLAPGLSTVQLPRLEIGRAAAQALLASFDSGAPAPDASLPWVLVARGTS
jgi:LacI family transcriptional regulator, gluconate utilization system Gnt-I transcriptional repressor